MTQRMFCIFVSLVGSFHEGSKCFYAIIPFNDDFVDLICFYRNLSAAKHEHVLYSI